MLALAPPGNIAKDLASYKRSLFARLGDPSGLAFPEMAPLAFARRAAGLPRPPRAAVKRCLEAAWIGVEGAFSSRALLLSGGCYYLELSGPTDSLAARAEAVLGELTLVDCGDAPIEAGKGFFLCRSEAKGNERDELGLPPALAFRDCSLVLVRLRFGADPFSATAWRELAGAKRRTGPSAAPSQRRRR